MKRFYLLAAAALLLAPAASAQQVRYGLKLGATYSKYTYHSNPQPNERLLAAGGGLMARYDLAPNHPLSLQAELLYLRKGSSNERLHYYEVPVLTRLNLAAFNLPTLLRGHLNLNRFAVEVGPQLSSVFTPAHRHLTRSADARTSFDRSQYAAFQVGYAAGLSYEVPEGWSLTIRHTHDITGVMRGNGVKGKRNAVFHAQVGYIFGGKQ
ncbi:PorT family protein [Hymenobacter oligotrophus]|uniref:PorT family protein n=1 Tax=Hymenobacter oligotrophus TaxID=2319843 RepID=A0A3B7QZQ7_9BACT|nr:porin family protein [Hymenobacter oligotrophus]AYA36902.1 PorT family protein [Hymenobacter oligotrophus]